VSRTKTSVRSLAIGPDLEATLKRLHSPGAALIRGNRSLPVQFPSAFVSVDSRVEFTCGREKIPIAELLARA